MFKNIKELFRLRKVIEEKNVELNNLNNNILELNKEKENRKYKIRNFERSRKDWKSWKFK